MTDIQTITTFLGWCSIINIGILLFVAVWLIAFRDFTRRIHTTMLGVDQDVMDPVYFQFVGNYKLAILLLNVVPYFALRIMA